MTAYFSYVGSLKGEGFEWDKTPASNTASNLPPRLVPANKLHDIGVSTLWVMGQVDDGHYVGRQLDWGAWGLKMTGAQLCALFGDAHEYAGELAALAAGETYVLVAAELW